MAILDPAARVTLLRALAAALRDYATDPAAASLAAMRLMRRAACCWRDLLAQPGRDVEYTILLIAYGTASQAGVTAADCGAAVLALAAWTPPYTLAAVAVAVNLPSLDPAATLAQLRGLVLDLSTARERGGVGHYPIAWTPHSDAAASPPPEC